MEGPDSAPVIEHMGKVYEQGRQDERRQAERNEADLAALIGGMMADLLSAASQVLAGRAPAAAEFFAQKSKEVAAAVQEWQVPPEPEQAEQAEPEQEKEG